MPQRKRRAGSCRQGDFPFLIPSLLSPRHGWLCVIQYPLPDSPKPWSPGVCSWFLVPGSNVLCPEEVLGMRQESGCLWVSLNVPGCPWASLSVPGCPWMSLSVPRCLWVSLSVPECPWMTPDVLGCPWVPLDVPGHLHTAEQPPPASSQGAVLGQLQRDTSPISWPPAVLKIPFSTAPFSIAQHFLKYLPYPQHPWHLHQGQALLWTHHWHKHLLILIQLSQFLKYHIANYIPTLIVP